VDSIEIKVECRKSLVYSANTPVVQQKKKVLHRYNK